MTSLKKVASKSPGKEGNVRSKTAAAPVRAKKKPAKKK
jgi:hypothetical protein